MFTALLLSKKKREESSLAGNPSYSVKGIGAHEYRRSWTFNKGKTCPRQREIKMTCTGRNENTEKKCVIL